jgi:hypothetical protein
MTHGLRVWGLAAVVVLLVVGSGLGVLAGHSVLSRSPGKAPSSNSDLQGSATTSNPPLSVSLSINPSQLQEGQSINVQTTVNGGTSPYSYSYTGLPSGCPNQNSPSFSCVPTSTGNFNAAVGVMDARGNQSSSNSVGIDVTSSNNGNGNGNGNSNNSSNPFSSLLSGLGGFLSIVLIFGIIGFITWILLVVGIWVIAIVLLRRLPKKPAAAGPTVTCAACGTVIPVGSKFCLECGRSTAPKAP